MFETITRKSIIENDQFFEMKIDFHIHTHTQPFYGSVDFVRDNPGEPVPEETFTHPHSS